VPFPYLTLFQAATLQHLVLPWARPMILFYQPSSKRQEAIDSTGRQRVAADTLSFHSEGDVISVQFEALYVGTRRW
jgi:hypothetical protein